MEASPLDVAIVSRHGLISAGLAVLVGYYPTRAVVRDGAALDGEPGPFEVALYDLGMLADADPQHLVELQGWVARAPVVGLRRDRRPDLDRMAWAAGVAEMVPESVTARELVEALERATNRRPPIDDDLDDLAPREREILALIGAGLSNRDIAERLFLSPNSIKTYIRTAYKKIGVTSRSQAVIYVVERGLRPLPRPGAASHVQPAGLARAGQARRGDSVRRWAQVAHGRDEVGRQLSRRVAESR